MATRRSTAAPPVSACVFVCVCVRACVCVCAYACEQTPCPIELAIKSKAARAASERRALIDSRREDRERERLGPDSVHQAIEAGKQAGRHMSGGRGNDQLLACISRSIFIAASARPAGAGMAEQAFQS